MICRETTAKHTRFEASIFRSCWGLELGPSPKARTRRRYLYGNLKAYQLLCAFWLLISLSLCGAAEARQVRNATNTFEPWLPACLLACITKIWDDLNDPSAGKFIHQSVNREEETRVCCSKWFSVHLSRVIKRGCERDGDRRESDTWSFGCCCRIGVYHLCMMVTCKSRYLRVLHGTTTATNDGGFVELFDFAFAPDTYLNILLSSLSVFFEDWSNASYLEACERALNVFISRGKFCIWRRRSSSSSSFNHI